MARISAGAKLVLTMAGSAAEADKIARSLVEEHLAACVNIVGPARSIYRWRGAVEEAQEYMLIVKTRAAFFSRVERRVKELHSYEVPEIVALTITGGSKPYLDWLMDSTEPPSKRSAPQR